MKIALLCGGSSSERDISFKSAAGVMAHMDNVHEVTAVDTGRSEIFTDFTLQKDKPGMLAAVNDVLKKRDRDMLRDERTRGL